MKILCILTCILFTVQALAEQKDKTKTQPVIAKVPKKAPEAPCAKTAAEDVLKKLEEKKKEEATKGLGLSLQGAGSAGCSVK